MKPSTCHRYERRDWDFMGNINANCDALRHIKKFARDCRDDFLYYCIEPENKVFCSMTRNSVPVESRTSNP